MMFQDLQVTNISGDPLVFSDFSLGWGRYAVKNPDEVLSKGWTLCYSYMYMEANMTKLQMPNVQAKRTWKVTAKRESIEKTDKTKFLFHTIL